MNPESYWTYSSLEYMGRSGSQRLISAIRVKVPKRLTLNQTQFSVGDLLRLAYPGLNFEPYSGNSGT